MSDESTAIRTLWQEYTDAANTGDLARFSATFADDIVFSAPAQKAISGKTAVVKWAKDSLFDPFKIRLVFQLDEVEASGAWAWARGRFTNGLTPVAGGDQMELSGNFLNIFRRQSNGAWKFSRVCFNYDTPDAQRQ